ncbi:hypothetical protein S40293_09492 [Stachybotrys chartarum IBT 40293]|nr:hypothetical protein S40293_09492 [Stachybotrys chartarum IBT 40293]
MAKYWLFIICTFTLVGVHAADDLSDWSSDLATDLGPLLALFGDNMTRQYLSESTSFLDYFIFAMGPVGILSAIVSTIRVCGSPSLRAFIGRSQEGDGIVEVELCTSTSRDVCELFNKGGITRVLGQPKILELIYISPRPHTGQGANEKELYLFRKCLEKLKKGENYAGWKEKTRRKWPFASDSKPSPLAPRPNLSLNVGIRKQDDWVFSVVAIVGFFLQVGVVLLAGVGVWILGWNDDEEGTPASRDYPPVMFITGTILMCAGMCCCAALIGETTDERRFERNKNDSRESDLYWLQPGKQEVGGQSFDAFAYTTRTTGKDESQANDDLLCWTSSTKNFKDFGTQTIFSVLAVLVGYIMHFIGLRGLRAWVSLAQFGITLVMSLLRGLLRMQRLGRDANRILRSDNAGKKLDQVTGHELDWLAFEVTRPEAAKLSWHIIGYSNCESEESQNLGKELLQNRARLAFLTGNVHKSADSNEYEEWGDEYVKVRSKARQLSAAFCQAATNLVQKGSKNTQLQLQVAVSIDQKKHCVPIEVMLEQDMDLPGWKIDCGKVEAILGLWMWSWIQGEKPLENTDTQPQLARVVATGDSTQKVIQMELDLWLGPDKVKLVEHKIDLKNGNTYGLESVWKNLKVTGATTTLKPELEGRKESQQRFCGWACIRSNHQNLNEKEEEELGLQAVQVSPTVSMLDVFAQDLFAAFIESIKGLQITDTLAFREEDGKPRLGNKKVKTLANVFVEKGLGSYDDAFLCIIPALHRPGPEAYLQALLEGADGYRRTSDWERAEILMQWACEYFCLNKDAETSLFTTVLRKTGELYRWSLANPHDFARQKFGMNGINWMINTYGDRNDLEGIQEILDGYWKIAQGVAGNAITSVATVDGKLIISGLIDGTIQIWDRATGKCRHVLKGHSGRIASVTYAPNSKHIISGSDDTTIKIWAIDTGECIKTLEGHSSDVASVAYLTHGKHIISGSNDNTIKIWDIDTGECMKTFEGHRDWVRSVAYSPNGKHIISGSDNKTIKI